MTKSRSEADDLGVITPGLWSRFIKKEVLRDSRALRSPCGYFTYYMVLAERRERRDRLMASRVAYEASQ